MKRVLFTHTDLDGAGSAVIFNAFNLRYSSTPVGKNKIIYCNNGSDIDDKITSYVVSPEFKVSETKILIVDICPSDNMLQMLMSIGASVTVLDHHNTNKWALNYLPNSSITNENNCCGTSLFYDYFCTLDSSFKNHNLLIDHFVDTVRSYDTYEWKVTNNIEAKRLNALFKLLGMENFVDEFSQRMALPYPYVDKHYGTDLIRIDHKSFVENALRIEQDYIDSITPAKIITMNIKGFKCAIKYLADEDNVSELGNQFLERYPEYDVFIGIYLNTKTISYRSKQVDCAKEFAVPMGGGGHKYASGNKLSDDNLQKITDTIFQKLLQTAGSDENPRDSIGFFDHLVGNA